MLAPLLCLAQQPTDADRVYFQQQSNKVSGLFRSKEIYSTLGGFGWPRRQDDTQKNRLHVITVPTLGLSGTPRTR
jgi:hypothetical protein